MASTNPAGLPNPTNGAQESLQPNKLEAPARTSKDINAEVEDVDHQLPPAPNPPKRQHPDFIHCLPPDLCTYRKFSVFTAGSIEMGSAIHWQTRLVSYLQDLPITVCNPRRGHWDTTTTPREKDEAFNRQVQWELSALETVSVICFFFDKNTKSPVTMLELGLWAKSGKVVVCCDSGFWKSGNVHITCRRYGIPFVERFEDMEKLIREKLHEKGMRLAADGSNDLVDGEGKKISNEGPKVDDFRNVYTGIQIRRDDTPVESKDSKAKTKVPDTQEKSAVATPATDPSNPPAPKRILSSSVEKKHSKLQTLIGKLAGKKLDNH